MQLSLSPAATFTDRNKMPGTHLFQDRQDSLERVTSSEVGLCCTWLCSITSSKL